MNGDCGSGGAPAEDIGDKEFESIEVYKDKAIVNTKSGESFQLVSVSSGQMNQQFANSATVEDVGKPSESSKSDFGSGIKSFAKTVVNSFKKGGFIGAALAPSTLANGELSEAQLTEGYIEGAYQAGIQVGVTDAENHRGNSLAVIGEQQTRVIREAKNMGALQIRPSWPDMYKFGSEFMNSFSKSVRDQISVAYNRGWVNGIMNSGFRIVDIGRAMDYRNKPISEWYKAELKEIAKRQYLNYERQMVFDTYNFPSYGR
ncbi:hypothetical protein [Psychrosphaera algicola]|uniref:Uncharacterized protein n=1 Tax=Psychrosphaera algicola TaxID=3023714 RepID=A0ABT5FHZ7_9GAMM|nr:hypothetical protein [Psychrosphaera sp. G1-22]MDC2890814.1 hypothetical protein [Psychrosphaera sp. G1-22]